MSEEVTRLPQTGEQALRAVLPKPLSVHHEDALRCFIDTRQDHARTTGGALFRNVTKDRALISGERLLLILEEAAADVRHGVADYVRIVEIDTPEMREALFVLYYDTMAMEFLALLDAAGLMPTAEA